MVNLKRYTKYITHSYPKHFEVHTKCKNKNERKHGTFPHFRFFLSEALLFCIFFFQCHFVVVQFLEIGPTETNRELNKIISKTPENLTYFARIALKSLQFPSRERK